MSKLQKSNTFFLKKIKIFGFLFIYDKKAKKLHKKIDCLQFVYNSKKEIAFKCYFSLLLRAEYTIQQIGVISMNKVSFRKNLSAIWQKWCKNARSTRGVFNSKMLCFDYFMKRE